MIKNIKMGFEHTSDFFIKATISKRKYEPGLYVVMTREDKKIFHIVAYKFHFDPKMDYLSLYTKASPLPLVFNIEEKNIINNTKQNVN